MSTGYGLYPMENVQAGCQQCHATDMVLDQRRPVLEIDDGKDLFRQRGCVGCHRLEGYDREPEELNSVTQQIKLFDKQKPRQPEAATPI